MAGRRDAARVRDAVLSSIKLKRFRGFRQYSVSFGKTTYLVGPNNAGKSTILTALRMADAQLRIAFAKRPTLYVDEGDVHRLAYPMSLDDFQTLSESVRYDFGSDESRLQVSWKGGTQFTAAWPAVTHGTDAEDHREPYFFLSYVNGGQPRLAADVRRHYKSLGVVPPLSPVDTAEPVRAEKYVRSNIGGRLSSRHFRNQLFLLKQAGKLQEFFAFANEWTPELRLVDLRVSSNPPGLDVFYVEGTRKLEREIAWAGDGMQVWWQIIHHIYRSADLPTLILDEPEVFLHPDLQRRLVRLLEDTDKQVIVATHSSELLSEVEPRQIALVDRSTRSARRVRDDSGLIGLSDQVGSRFNLAMAKALRSRVVLFLEGQDAQLLRMTASIVGLNAIEKESGIAIVEMEGFSPHKHVEAFEWLCRDYLASSVKPFVILDRDYRSDGQLDDVRGRFDRLPIPVHIWARKELESYYLQPELVARVAAASLGTIEPLLEDAAAEHKATVASQLASHRIESEHGPRKDKATILQEAASEFEILWRQQSFRLGRTPAKAVLAGLNRRLQAAGHKAVSFRALARSQDFHEVEAEMLGVLREIAALL